MTIHDSDVITFPIITAESYCRSGAQGAPELMKAVRFSKVHQQVRTYLTAGSVACLCCTCFRSRHTK